MTNPPSDLKPNRLIHETSPYLRQHAHNPVDWYPWSEEALTKAHTENKPILLSIGYSACHWCHVMAHECFEDADIARFMNESFVNIKVDREERPDLDQIYQTVAQLITRSGGWPLTVFLTPDLKPFFGGTYFPPEDRFGRPGFPRVLEALAEAYKNDPAAIAENAKKLTDALSQLETAQSEESTRPDAAFLRTTADRMLAAFDWKNGGFGAAPKFPNTMALSFLWRYGAAAQFGMAQEATLVALTKMAGSGLYDQLGGGFHRYSVDERWTVPHFEKMLYDNALLLKLYAEALLEPRAALTRDDRRLYTDVIDSTVSYIVREMTANDGHFFSTQDADSDGKEGTFFVWSPSEIRQTLTDPTEAEAALLYFGVTDRGNFETTGKTVLSRALPVAEIAGKLGVSAAEAQNLIESARQSLFNTRAARVSPGRDEKSLTSWNALMISAMSWAARALDSEGRTAQANIAQNAANTAMNFLLTTMSRENGRLWSVYSNGRPHVNAYLDDYAFAAAAALDVARFSANHTEATRLITQAAVWCDAVVKHFSADDECGFYFTSDDHEKLIKRPRTFFDQAIPAGNAVMIENFLALGALLDRSDFRDRGDRLAARISPLLDQYSLGMGETANAALLTALGAVTVTSRQGSKAAQLCVNPLIFGATVGPAKADREDFLVCHRQSCGLPITKPEEALREALAKLRF